MESPKSYEIPTSNRKQYALVLIPQWIAKSMIFNLAVMNPGRNSEDEEEVKSAGAALVMLPGWYFCRKKKDFQLLTSVHCIIFKLFFIFFIFIVFRLSIVP